MNDTDQKMAKAGLTAELLKMNFSSSYVSQLVNGLKKPSLERAAQIEEAIGLPMRAWPDGSFLTHYWKKVTAK